MDSLALMVVVLRVAGGSSLDCGGAPMPQQPRPTLARPANTRNRGAPLMSTSLAARLVSVAAVLRTPCIAAGAPPRSFLEGWCLRIEMHRQRLRQPVRHFGFESSFNEMETTRGGGRDL